MNASAVLEARPKEHLPFEIRGRGPVVLLLHGFTGSRQSWDDDLLDGLVRVGRSVVAVDLPGHGSAPAPETPGAMKDAVAAVVGVLDATGARDADLLGYSMGGRIALATAILHPARVRRLVVEGASPGLSDASERSARRQADEALAEAIVRDGIEAFVERWLAQPLFASQAALPEEVRQRERRRRLAGDPGGLAAALCAFGVGHQPSLWERLGEVRADVLAVAGERDAKFRGIGEAMVRLLPRARLAIAPEAGHAVHLEAPNWFRGVVEDFLREDRREERT